MKRSIFALLALLLASVASAQTHPCDLPPTPNPTTKNSTVTVGFCHDQKDANGATDAITAFKIYLDGNVVLTWTSPTGLTPKTPTPNAAGFYYYEAPAIAVTKGNRGVSVAAVDADGESALSATFPFQVKGPGPRQVSGTRVQ